MPITITVTNRWWPTLDARALDLLEQGVPLTDAERVQAGTRPDAEPRLIVATSLNIYRPFFRPAFAGSPLTLVGKESRPPGGGRYHANG